KSLFIFLLCCVFAVSSQTVTINTDFQYKVNLPAKKTAKTPVLIMLHGYGSNEEDLFDISKSLDQRFITFSIRAPFSARDQGYCWYKIDMADGKKTHDYAQAKESRNKVLAFISAACKAYKLDSNQVFLMGFSQGAIMSCEIALSKPSKIKGVVALSGFLLDGTKQLKTDPLKMPKLKFFIGHGTQDNIIEFSKGQETAKFLTEKKAGVTFKSYDIPHSINGKELNDLREWLASNLQKEKKEEPKK
ncbi:MAG: phospholipase/Carboxylesterase, partial [Bacteroidetes bacterium]|nr:phospholipase/Carboxylesterase [Bacteroidota bacterium]